MAFQHVEVIDIPDDDPIWDAFVHYVGALCANLVLSVSPEKIVLGECRWHTMPLVVHPVSLPATGTTQSRLT